jgi:hypothetical protein
MTVRESVFDHHFKLYRTGEFFDLSKDPEESKPLQIGALAGDAAGGAKKLQAALDQFKDARPAELDREFEQSGKAGKPGKKKKRNAAE